MSAPLAVVLNPAAGRGRARRQWPSLAIKLKNAFGTFKLYTTTLPGEESALAEQAYSAGARHILAVGGDGTVNGVLNGLLECTPGDPLAPDWHLSTVPAGTANELASTLGYTSTDIAVARIAKRNEQWFDLLHATYTNPEGNRASRSAFAAVSWGAAAEISYRTSTSKVLKRLGGRFSYYAVTLIVTLTYPYFEGDITIDDRGERKIRHYTGLVCNLETLGGGMKLAPGASPRDGIGDMLLFEDIPRKDILLQPPSWLFEGNHISHPEVSLAQGKRFWVNGPGNVRVDADGEAIGSLPLEVNVVPGTLPLFA